ncbi:MAG: Cytochrome c oxidase polypeptide III (EC [uncultured Campylobacterales bacterium]|uniref:Cytochrome c oxidase polypeptide III (EC) n=1 Tax=uncultured Campylobacterales bacterium TaxID=352960 RepID=A0A6S6T0D4_9BACT|nr:MAG: Cytochrome c oxidase polypeptide III (EC [uncultured Campylobacterales bacterium]
MSVHGSTEVQKYAYDKNGKPHEIVDFADDYIGAKLGFWLFLFTEVMLFSVLFITYMFYLYNHQADFIEQSGGMNILLGGINTVLLLLSAYFMGMSLVSMKQNNVSKSKLYLILTIVSAIIFLTIKYFEWAHEFHIGIYPNSEKLLAMSQGANLFFGLYFTMTGLHAIHIILGIGVMLWVFTKMRNNSINSKHYIVLENTALYWDLVHLVWVFLFPLVYIIGL